ncbi:hypothetical protein ON064_02250 [Planococcus sp. A6]|uniref:hypothetical protein n=1 Tax=Planococcus sp. A6 TaxID=2992760 RepID=UPI00237C44FD|nr:hypothetical protein [Planococcus sp. A6]MDE0581867.1 hypothetical protein [Planococcus sp. A6]
MWSRRPALGRPLATSQEERLSCCIGSPLTLGGWVISLIEVCLAGSASLSSFRLVGESLLGLGLDCVEALNVICGVAALLWVGLSQ